MDEEIIEGDSEHINERHPLQDHFLGWQCRVREYAMRNNEGRPTPGMCPTVFLESGEQVVSALKLVLVPAQPQESIQQLRFMSKKTYDPQERYKKAMQLLSSTFYQHIEDFSGLMTGLFPNDSNIAKLLQKEKRSVLKFDYQQQSFSILCSVEEFSKDKEDYEFTYWHNILFNPYLSPEVKVIGFEPDWSKSSANPSHF
ncbi:MAG: hypothetical protein P8L36_14435 [SAR324 cluster bacterium]|jgi:hypothetical protein|nr:hypothetical protein [SAR324 cluster bacterium]MDG2066173.1 hypothetical protein [SAR324 cluster bacterium]